MGTLIVDRVGKTYPGNKTGEQTVALDGVSFTVADNEFCALLGHSGCGKTTLLNLIAGFEQPGSGSITLDGVPVRRPGRERAVVFQDYALFPWLTVEGNIRFGLETQGRIAAGERQRIVDEHIRLVGLAGFERHLPHQLSGGMRQRVAIARALATDPQVLLLDEPFAALDAQNRLLMQDELARIWASETKTMLLVTHSIEEAIRLADRIVVLSRRPGRVRENIVVDLPRPRHEDSAGFIALRRHIRNLLNDEPADQLAVEAASVFPLA
ncbi:ABC transporter ATP-binding protein [Rhodocyclus tenuis]|uniref:NitT/TauT family transport system ATP-binding protein n=1 Tax=Rhodocyclus tenuis TaxID=1066 RepID=A0A840GJJ1_RHOTE|nr:ABC transporter ATP-binding protein [Rhodocyclus tenuis]MBB4248612.1 NitT/TauT family transport system ATP-binding protein [Rhodocyclus tenuis]